MMDFFNLLVDCLVLRVLCFTLFAGIFESYNEVILRVRSLVWSPVGRSPRAQLRLRAPPPPAPVENTFAQHSRCPNNERRRTLRKITRFHVLCAIFFSHIILNVLNVL